MKWRFPLYAAMPPLNALDVVRHRRVRNTAPVQGRLGGGRWQWYVVLIVFLLCSGLFPDDAKAGERP